MGEQGFCSEKIREVVIMKKFSKLIALALACVMALTVLTACGGGGASATTKNNAAVIASLNETRKAHGRTALTEAKELNVVAAKVIDSYIKYKENGTQANNAAYEQTLSKEVWQNSISVNGSSVKCVLTAGINGIPSSFEYTNYRKMYELDAQYIGMVSKEYGGKTYLFMVFAK